MGLKDLFARKADHTEESDCCDVQIVPVEDIDEHDTADEPQPRQST